MNKQRLIEDINRRLKSQKYVVIGIDGRCGSGKTTLANELSKIYDCNVIHMDDFFLRPEQRTKERYKEPGGNVDYERFNEQVLQPIRNRQSYMYQPFDCMTMTLQHASYIDLKPLIVIEGSYSMRPELIDVYDIKVFMDIDPKVQLERIEKRNPDKINMFIEKWIPYEESYFSYFDTKNVCDYIIDTSKNIIL